MTYLGYNILLGIILCMFVMFLVFAGLMRRDGATMDRWTGDEWGMAIILSVLFPIGVIVILTKFELNLLARLVEMLTKERDIPKLPLTRNQRRIQERINARR